MLCPICKSNTTVYDTREAFSRVRRRRACLKCKRRFSTLEIPTLLLAEVVAAIKTVKKLGPMICSPLSKKAGIPRHTIRQRRSKPCRERKT